MKKITEAEFDNAVANGVVLVDFYADWCGPCKMLGPVLEEMENTDKDFDLVKVNVDDEGALAQRFGVMSIPTIVLFKDGKQVAASTGFRPKEQIRQFLDQAK